MHNFPRRMLRIIQRFGKHFSCNLQSEYVMVGRFLKPYTGKAVGGELDLMVLIGEAEERACDNQTVVYCLALCRDRNLISYVT
jgi:hypothetical protein